HITIAERDLQVIHTLVRLQQAGVEGGQVVGDAARAIDYQLAVGGGSDKHRGNVAHASANVEQGGTASQVDRRRRLTRLPLEGVSECCTLVNLQIVFSSHVEVLVVTRTIPKQHIVANGNYLAGLSVIDPR